MLTETPFGRRVSFSRAEQAESVGHLTGRHYSISSSTQVLGTGRAFVAGKIISFMSSRTSAASAPLLTEDDRSSKNIFEHIKPA